MLGSRKRRPMPWTIAPFSGLLWVYTMYFGSYPPNITLFQEDPLFLLVQSGAFSLSVAIFWRNKIFYLIVSLIMRGSSIALRRIQVHVSRALVPLIKFLKHLNDKFTLRCRKNRIHTFKPHCWEKHRFLNAYIKINMFNGLFRVKSIQ